MFGALLLFVSFAAFACSPLPPCQDDTNASTPIVKVYFVADGLMKIPLEFAYSETEAVILSKPKFAINKEDAMKNIRQYIKGAVTCAIRQEARKDRIGKNITDIANQINPTVYYSPLKCASLIKGKESIPRDGANPLFCIVEEDLVTYIAYTAQRGRCSSGELLPLPLYEVPLAYQQFIVSLTITNSIVAGWSRDKWDLTLLAVERQLRSSTYATAFKTINIVQF